MKYLILILSLAFTTAVFSQVITEEFDPRSEDNCNYIRDEIDNTLTLYEPLAEKSENNLFPEEIVVRDSLHRTLLNQYELYMYYCGTVYDPE